MRRSIPNRATLLAACWWLAAGPVWAQITVEGIAERQIVTDKARFRVSATAGYSYDCRLDTSQVPVATWLEVTRAGYHELHVERRALDTGATEAKLIQFIVKASERGDTEWGLPPWTPYPLINSAAGEFAGAHLRLVTPRDWPQALEIPVAVFVENIEGRAVRVNGLLEASPHPAIQLRRGVGSGLLAANHPAGPLTYAPSVKGLQATNVINLEAQTSWANVSGIISGAVTWPDNSRVAVTETMTIPVGASLTIGPGSVVRLGAGVDIVLNGNLTINGTAESPVVFTPARRSEPWGGFICHGSAARLVATGAIFTGGCANQGWFDQNTGYDVHRKEQALLLLDEACAELTDCCLFDNQGQAGHGKDGYLTLTRCLLQRFITCGEYNGGSVQIRQSALVEFPVDDERFVDGDNDGIYFTTGHHVVSDTLIGWAKDDGLDSGSGGAGAVLATNCWVESCYHEGFAWSGGGRVVTNLDCVVINCGQGIEAGWSSSDNSPEVFADRCLSLGNSVGARFGDNYDWTYNGFLRVSNSLLLYNQRNIWGMNWDDWTYRSGQMDLRGNYVSVPETNHPGNVLWQPAGEGWRLARFMTTPPASPIGLAFATRALHAELSVLTNGLPVGLSTFTTNTVTTEYLIESPGRVLAVGTLAFAPGQTVCLLPMSLELPPATDIVRVTLRNPTHAEYTGPTQFHFLKPMRPRLIPPGSVWRYLDDGSNQGVAWQALEFNDESWKSGPAELGFGDNDEATVINGGPSGSRFATTYFRRQFYLPDPAAFSGLIVNLRRDDGAIVYLNTNEVFRSNMPTGEVTQATYTGQATTSETAFFSTNVNARLLRPGTNLLAVELHQADKDSSDLSFELELIGVPQPRLEFGRLGMAVILFWADPAYYLEQADSVAGPWQSAAEAAFPATVSPPSPKFYRLRRP